MPLRLVFAAVVFFGAAGCAPSPAHRVAMAPSDEAVADSVRRVWDTINAAWGRGDTTALGPLLAPGYTLVGGSGSVYDRARLLAYVHQNAGGADGGIATRDHRARVLGAARDVAIHTAEVTDYFDTAEGLDTVVTRTTDVFERRGGRWVLVGSHESLVRPPRRLRAD